MPTKVWAIGEEVLSVDFNPMVQEQVVATFPNAAARDAAIPAPKQGMQCYLTGTAEFLQYAGTAWRRPWNLPWGQLFHAKLASNSTAITGPGNVPGLGTNLTLPANRRIRCTFNGHAQNDTVAAEGRIGINFDATQLHFSTVQCATANRGLGVTVVATTTTPDAASHAYQVTMQRSAGAGLVLTSAGSEFLVEDIGPAAAAMPALAAEEPTTEGGTP